MFEAWDILYPDLPRPFLTATFRGPVDQEKAFDEGRSRAKFGESLHNFRPALAFDVAFKNERGGLDWSFDLFEKMAVLGDQVGLEWGGRWQGLVDGPHFQVPVKASEVAKGVGIPKLPSHPSLPGQDGWRLVIMRDGAPLKIIEMLEAEDVVMRYSAEKRRVYVDLRKEST